MCKCAMDRSLWVDEQISPSWIRTTCRVCGKFIGRRLVVEKKNAGKKQTQATLGQETETDEGHFAYQARLDRVRW